MSSKSTEQTLRPLELSLSQIRKLVAVVEEAGVVDVVDVADAADVEAAGVVAETRNKRTKPPTRLLVTNRLVRRGNVRLNPMAVHTPE